MALFVSDCIFILRTENRKMDAFGISTVDKIGTIAKNSEADIHLS